MSGSDSPASTTPDLSDPNVSGNSLLIGFSFGVTPDGSPGRCNRDIAAIIKRDILRSPSNARPWVGAQWEIYDALEEMRDSGFQAGTLIPLSHVVPPPPISEDDVVSADALLGYLKQCRIPAALALVSKIPEVTGDDTDAAKIAGLFSRVLEDRMFYETFEPLLDFHDLHRQEKGLLGLEKRRIPNPNDYPDGLRRFQARRVNRLILETILPETSFRRGRYLNTQQVAEHVFRQVKREGRTIQHVIIYAHPEHWLLCKHKVTDSVTAMDRDASDLNLSFGSTTLFWDRGSAQVWCRSKENWEVYIPTMLGVAPPTPTRRCDRPAVTGGG